MAKNIGIPYYKTINGTRFHRVKWVPGFNRASIEAAAKFYRKRGAKARIIPVITHKNQGLALYVYAADPRILIF